MVAPSKAEQAKALYLRVLADPRDDAGRAVLADVLQELGDPRGELIALQLAQPSDAEARSRDIVAKHAARLLGPIASCVLLETAVFEDGLLSACGVHSETKTPPREVLEAPEWESVRSLSLLTPKLGAWHTDVAPLVRSRAMRSLRELHYLHGDALLALTTPLALQRLRLSVVRALPPILHADRILPSLVDLHCGVVTLFRDMIESLLAAPLVRRVRRLALISEYSAREVLVAAQNAHADLAATTVTLERKTETGWQWRLERDGDGGLTTLDADLIATMPQSTWYRPLDEGLAVVEVVAPRLRSLRVNVSGPLAAEEVEGMFETLRAATPGAAHFLTRA